MPTADLAPALTAGTDARLAPLQVTPQPLSGIDLTQSWRPIRTVRNGEPAGTVIFPTSIPEATTELVIKLLGGVEPADTLSGLTGQLERRERIVYPQDLYALALQAVARKGAGRNEPRDQFIARIAEEAAAFVE